MLPFAILLWNGAAFGKSWCASPLVVHEWGVHAMRSDGAQVAGTPLPSWFYRDTSSRPKGTTPVRELPPDSGIRDLPILQLYSPRAPLPVAIEVGFGADEARAWWPQVDRLITASAASSPEALAARASLLEARAGRDPHRSNPPLGPDPTKQLGWDLLSLAQSPASSAKPPEQPWVESLREVPGALWVNARAESDRFVFYEATTRARPDLSLERADGWSADRPHYLVRNTSAFTVHDVIILANGRAWSAPAVPPGATAGFLLDQALDRAELERWLRARWLEGAAPPQAPGLGGDECVMMRDPAIPVDASAGHRLYAPELDVLFEVWADRLLSGDTPRVIYREDTEAIDARMPISIYTDMFHFVELNRLGVVVVEGVKL